MGPIVSAGGRRGRSFCAAPDRRLEHQARSTGVPFSHNGLQRSTPLTDAQIQAKATIAAALIQSRSIDAEALGSLNKDISNHKLAHLKELTDRIYAAISS
jgi:hypothetical protein